MRRFVDGPRVISLGSSEADSLMSAHAVPAETTARAPGFAEFVALIALTMGITALSIDNLLPAFPPIGIELGVADPNRLQMLIYAYMAGFAVMQVVYGPLSDVWGRRPVLLSGLALYAAATLLAVLSRSFDFLIAVRVLQGMGAASARVITVSIVRDRFAGREMARVMSFVMMIFITVPIFAPGIGSLFLVIGGWRLIFATMLLLSVAVSLWIAIRLPETLHPEYRFAFSFARIGRALGQTVTTRASLGYATAMGLMFGGLLGYLGSSQQVFQTTVYGLGPWFPVAFGAIALVMGCASFTNSRLVRRLGMRRLSHAGICGSVVTASLLLLAALLFGGRPPLLLFGLILAANMFLFSLTVPNFNAIAMEPLGAIAGTASSLIGFYTTLAGTLIGLFIGQQFDGTVTPLSAGFLACDVSCLAIVLWAERGRLFQPHHHDPA